LEVGDRHLLPSGRAQEHPPPSVVDNNGDGKQTFS